MGVARKAKTASPACRKIPSGILPEGKSPGGRSEIWASRMRGLNFSRRQNQISRAILGPKNRPFLLNHSLLCFLVEKLKILLTKKCQKRESTRQKNGRKTITKIPRKKIVFYKLFSKFQKVMSQIASEFLIQCYNRIITPTDVHYA